MKLISMTDFVLEQTKINQFRDDCEFAYPVRKYAKFLKQPLALWMFVPCDENGYILNEPISLGMFESENPYFEIYLKSKKEYHKAKERCLLDGIEVDAVKHHISQKRNIEYLANFGTLQLTQTAIKQFMI